MTDDRGNVRKGIPYVGLELACHAALHEVQGIRNRRGSYFPQTDVLELFRDSFVLYKESLASNIAGVEQSTASTTRPKFSPLFLNYEQYKVLNQVLKDLAQSSDITISDFPDHLALAYTIKITAPFNRVLQRKTSAKQRLRDCRKIYDILIRLLKRSDSVSREYFRRM